ncbi:MAG: endonuclease [Saprospiraceae bacterium]|nr:endonuclease [Saprospiraceae bacterium]
MLPDLCRWHRADKVDSIEYARSMAIARIQSNINPFIFDPSLAERCYCANYQTITIKSYSFQYLPQSFQRSLLHRHPRLQRTSHHEDL